MTAKTQPASQPALIPTFSPQGDGNVHIYAAAVAWLEIG